MTCICGVFGFALAGLAENGNEETHRWHFSAGPAWRTGMEVDARGGSSAPSDGWVRPDGTGAGSTMDWGVNNAGQFHVDPDPVWGGNVYTLSLSDGGASAMSEDNASALGATAALTYDLAEWRSFRLGARLGMAGYWGMRERLDGVDYGNIYLMPSGDLMYGGGLPPLVSGGNPLTDSEVLLTPVGTFPAGAARLTVKSDLYQLALGPDVSWEPAERLRFSLSPALLLNLASLRMSGQDANALGQTGRTDENATKFLVGGGLQFGASYSLTDTIGIGGQIGYEWIQKASENCGSRSVDVDYSALTVSAGVVVAF